jgi:hypothetical protein
MKSDAAGFNVGWLPRREMKADEYTHRLIFVIDSNYLILLDRLFVDGN